MPLCIDRGINSRTAQYCSWFCSCSGALQCAIGATVQDEGGLKTAATKPSPRNQSFRSNNQFEMRPQLRQRRARLAADVHVHISFGGRRVWVGNHTSKLHI